MIDLSNSQTKIQFSHFLKEMVYKKGITRERLAIRSDKSIKTITRYLSGDLSQLPKTRINYHTFKRLLDALECNENEFSRFVEQTPKHSQFDKIKKEHTLPSAKAHHYKGFPQRLTFTKALQGENSNLATDDLNLLIRKLTSDNHSITAIASPPGNGKTLLLEKLSQFSKSSLNWKVLYLDLRKNWDKTPEELCPAISEASCILLDNYEKNKTYKKYSAIKLINKLASHSHVIFTCLPEDIRDIKTELSADILNLETLNKNEISYFIKQQEKTLGDNALFTDLTTLIIQSNLVLDVLSIPYFIKTACQILKARRTNPEFSPLNVKWLMDQLNSHLLNHKNHESRKDNEKSQLLSLFRGLPLSNRIQHANVFYKKVTHYGLLQTLRDGNSHEFLGTLLLLDIKNNKNDIFTIIESTLKTSQHDTALISTIVKSITFTHQTDYILQRLTTDIREVLWQKYLAQNEGCDNYIEILYNLDHHFLRKRESIIRKNLKYFNRWRNDKLLKLSHQLTNNTHGASNNSKDTHWKKISILDTKEQLSKFMNQQLIPPGTALDQNQLEVIMSESSHRFNSKLIKTINTSLERYPNHELCLYITRAFKQKLTALAYGELAVVYSEILKNKTISLVNPALKPIYLRLISNKKTKIKYRNIAAETICSYHLENKELLLLSNFLIDNLEDGCTDSNEIKLYSTVFLKLVKQGKCYADSTLKILKKSNSEFYFMLKKQYDESINSDNLRNLRHL